MFADAVFIWHIFAACSKLDIFLVQTFDDQMWSNIWVYREGNFILYPICSIIIYEHKTSFWSRQNYLLCMKFSRQFRVCWKEIRVTSKKKTHLYMLIYNAPESSHTSSVHQKSTRLDCYTNEVTDGNIYRQIDCVENSIYSGLRFGYFVLIQKNKFNLHVIMMGTQLFVVVALLHFRFQWERQGIAYLGGSASDYASSYREFSIHFCTGEGAGLKSPIFWLRNIWTHHKLLAI